MNLRFSISNLLCILLLLLTVSCGQEQGLSGNDQVANQQKTLRIVSLSGFLTELLVTAGYGDQIVGRDMTSVYPDSIQNLPNMGHVSQLNAESIIGLQPDVILAEAGALASSETLQQLKDGGLKVVGIPTRSALGNTAAALEALQAELDISDAAVAPLVRTINEDSLKLAAFLEQHTDQPSVLFLYARGAGRLMIAGTDTSADAMIQTAGGRNAVTAFEGFKALSPEALLEANPDIVLMFTSGLASLDGKEGLSEVPGMSQTKAYQNDRIIAMDGHYLLSFGPRSGKAALELAQQIHLSE